MILLPDNAAKLILFQRTSCQLLWKMNLVQCAAKIFPAITYERVVAIDGLFLKSRIAQLFEESLARDYEEIKKILPVKIHSILDIGCGLAGIDLFLFRHYNRNNRIAFHLLDKSAIDKGVYYGFQKNGSFYNSLNLAKKFLIINGIKSSRIYLHEADKKVVLSREKFDVVISILSWGYHYPVETYLNMVYQKMQKEGVLIIDIRKNTGGEVLIRRKFRNMQILSETSKSFRICSTKKF